MQPFGISGALDRVVPLDYGSPARIFVGVALTLWSLENDVYSSERSVFESSKRTVTLTDEDARHATRLLRLLSKSLAANDIATEANLLPAVPDKPGHHDLIERATIVWRSRRLRGRYFDPAIFGEPAWDLLMLLYITSASGERQTPGKLATELNTPLTTVLRWIGYLEKERLVERDPHPTDRRTVFIKLLERGKLALDDYLKALPG